MAQEHHIFHITTKLSVGTILYGFAVGCIMVGAPSLLFHIYQRQENRLLALETEIYKYREREWLFRTVDEKLSDQKSQLRYEVAEAITTLSKTKKIPVSIILGIIETESNWNLTAVNGAAMGAMQITTKAAAKSVKGSLFDPVTNIIAGCSHLYELHQQYIKDGVERETEFDPSLCAYNSGRLLGSDNKQITNYGYAMKVKSCALRYEALFRTSI